MFKKLINYFKPNHEIKQGKPLELHDNVFYGKEFHGLEINMSNCMFYNCMFYNCIFNKMHFIDFKKCKFVGCLERKYKRD